MLESVAGEGEVWVSFLHLLDGDRFGRTGLWESSENELVAQKNKTKLKEHEAKEEITPMTNTTKPKTTESKQQRNKQNILFYEKTPEHVHKRM